MVNTSSKFTKFPSSKRKFVVFFVGITLLVMVHQFYFITVGWRMACWQLLSHLLAMSLLSFISWQAVKISLSVAGWVKAKGLGFYQTLFLFLLAWLLIEPSSLVYLYRFSDSWEKFYLWQYWSLAVWLNIFLGLVLLILGAVSKLFWKDNKKQLLVWKKQIFLSKTGQFLRKILKNKFWLEFKIYFILIGQLSIASLLLFFAIQTFNLHKAWQKPLSRWQNIALTMPKDTEAWTVYAQAQD